MAFQTRLVDSFYRKGVRFDMAFDQHTDADMYCSEMLAKTLARATDGKIRLPYEKLTPAEIAYFSEKLQLPASEGPSRNIYSIDNTYLNQWAKKVYSFNFDSTTVR